jgi:hypothetical protein
MPSRALLRVVAYAIFAFSLVALLAARVLLADVKEAALAAGHELGQLGDLLRGEEIIQVNGERMHHASTYTDQDLGTVLDRFEGYCASSPGPLGRAMSDFPKELIDKALPKLQSRPARLGFVRDEGRGRGMVACFASDEIEGPSIAEKLERFLSTLRLGEFGKFRYAFAEKTKAGDTHVTTVWADGALDIRAMFPAEGDAAGADSLVLARPPNARRTLTAAAEGMPYALRVYESTDGAESLRTFYAGFMQSHDFYPVEDGDREGTAAYLRADGYQAFISIGEQQGKASVTLLEAGHMDGPPTATVEVTVE